MFLDPKPVFFFEEEGGSESAEGSSEELESVEGSSTEETTGSSEAEESVDYQAQYQQAEQQRRELERKLGQQGNELGQYRQYAPLLEALNRDPNLYGSVLGLVNKPQSEDDLNIGGGFSQERYENLYLESPAKANIYLNQCQIQAEKQTESQDYNRNMALQRGRQLLVNHYKDNAALKAKYSDPNYIVTDQDIYDVPGVHNQLEAEAQYVRDRMAKDKYGRYPQGAFQDAHKILSYNQTIQQTKIQTAEQTALNIQQGKPGATVVTPSGTSKAEIKPKFTTEMDEIDAKKEADKMTRQEREELLNEF